MSFADQNHWERLIFVFCYIILDTATGVFLKCSSFGSISIHSLPTCEISSVLPPASLIVD